MIGAVENIILTNLQEKFENFTVESFPADFKNYNFASAIGCLLIKFEGSDFAKPKSFSAVVQDRTLVFTVVIGLRQLNSYSDSYFYLDKVRHSLTGLNVWGEKLYPTKEKFIADAQNGDIYWGQQYKVKCESSQTEDL